MRELPTVSSVQSISQSSPSTSSQKTLPPLIHPKPTHYVIPRRRTHSDLSSFPIKAHSVITSSSHSHSTTPPQHTSVTDPTQHRQARSSMSAAEQASVASFIFSKPINTATTITTTTTTTTAQPPSQNVATVISAINVLNHYKQQSADASAQQQTQTQFRVAKPVTGSRIASLISGFETSVPNYTTSRPSSSSTGEGVSSTSKWKQTSKELEERISSIKKPQSDSTTSLNHGQQQQRQAPPVSPDKPVKMTATTPLAKSKSVAAEMHREVSNHVPLPALKPVQFQQQKFNAQPSEQQQSASPKQNHPPLKVAKTNSETKVSSPPESQVVDDMISQQNTPSIPAVSNTIVPSTSDHQPPLSPAPVPPPRTKISADAFKQDSLPLDAVRDLMINFSFADKVLSKEALNAATSPSENGSDLLSPVAMLSASPVSSGPFSPAVDGDVTDNDELSSSGGNTLGGSVSPNPASPHPIITIESSIPKSKLKGAHKKKSSSGFSPFKKRHSKSASSTSTISKQASSATLRPKWYDSIADPTERQKFLESLSKEERIRQEVSYEILTTEEDYVSDLKMILDVYVRPLKELKFKNPELTELFANLELILPVNQAFLVELQKCRTGPIMEGVGDVFLSVADFFKSYTMYCSNHSKAVTTLQKLLKSDQILKNFMKEVYSRPDFNGLNLESYLLKPVQRICKYPLLLKELLKSTNQDHPDRKSLEMAKEKIDAIVSAINEKTKHIEGMLKTIEAVRKIKGGNEIVQPTRKYVADGPVTMKSTDESSGGAGEFKKVHLFLFNDLLVITRPPSLMSRDKYQLIVSLDVTNMSMSDVTEEQYSNAWLLFDGFGDECFLMCANVLPEKIKWMNDLAASGVQQDPSGVEVFLPRFRRRSASLSVPLGGSSFDSRGSHDRSRTEPASMSASGSKLSTEFRDSIAEGEGDDRVDAEESILTISPTRSNPPRSPSGRILGFIISSGEVDPDDD